MAGCTRATSVVAVVAKKSADAPTLYEGFRREYPTIPLVMVTSTDDSPFIETVLDDEYSDYVYLPADDLPFGLIAVRCKRLIETVTTPYVLVLTFLTGLESDR